MTTTAITDDRNFDPSQKHGSALSTSTFVLSDVSCWDKATGEIVPVITPAISTGVGFLDHMIDQFNSHAQVGVSITVHNSLAQTVNNDAEGREVVGAADSCKNRNALSDQAALMGMVGSALGAELRKLLPIAAIVAEGGRRSRFCCPLDEALVECVMCMGPTSVDSTGTQFLGELSEFVLGPYGAYPKSGRSMIGTLQTCTLLHFFRSLAEDMGVTLSLRKVRGRNGHHIVESAFKAFSRALRCLIDGTSPGHLDSMWGVESESYIAGISLEREASLDRKTKETGITVRLALDGGKAGTIVRTGISTLDDFVKDLFHECEGLSLYVNCSGDLWVDDHHTSEDVSIAIGQVLNKALGTKAGLNRMWTASVEKGDAAVEVVMDLSNRPCLTHDLDLSRNGEEKVGDMSVEMIEHVFESLVMNGQMTVHLVQLRPGTARELFTAAARAFGMALGKCCAVDPRRAGKTASSKGTLSV